MDRALPGLLWGARFEHPVPRQEETSKKSDRPAVTGRQPAFANAYTMTGKRPQAGLAEDTSGPGAAS